MRQMLPATSCLSLDFMCLTSSIYSWLQTVVNMDGWPGLM